MCRLKTIYKYHKPNVKLLLLIVISLNYLQDAATVCHVPVLALTAWFKLDLLVWKFKFNLSLEPSTAQHKCLIGYLIFFFF